MMSKRLLITLLFALALVPFQVWAQELQPGTPVYVSLFDSGQVIKVDGNTGSITVLTPQPATAVLTDPEDMAIGPDGKLYICDGLNDDRIYRMNQDGTQWEVVYDFSKMTANQCGGINCPTGPEGPSFLASNGDLFFNTRIDAAENAHSGIWKIPAVTSVPVGGAFPLPVQLISADADAITFGEGTAVDHNGNLLIADEFGNRILFSPAPSYNSTTTLIQNTSEPFHVSTPVGIAVNSHGDVLVANNTANNVACFNSSGGFVETYADFSSTGDMPLYMEFDATGNLFVVTQSFDSNTNTFPGKVWKVTPAASPACSEPGNMTLLVDIGAAFTSNAPPAGLNGDEAVGLAVPTLAGPFVTLEPGVLLTLFSSPTATHQIQYPADAIITPGTTIMSTATLQTQSDFFNQRLAGSTFLGNNPNTQCIMYPANPIVPSGPCFTFEDKCFDSNGMHVTCPTTNGFDPQTNTPHNSEDILIYTTIENLPQPPPNTGLPINPGLITADDGQNDWFNIFTSEFVIIAPDPLTIKGGTNGFNSDFDAVDLGAASSVGLGIFQGFQTPLAPKNGKTFSVGTTIKVTFQVKNASGQFITNATAQLALVYLGTGSEQGVSPANFKGLSPNTFTYNTKSNTYQYYLNTTGFPKGNYSLTVFSNSFQGQFVTFTLD